MWVLGARHPTGYVMFLGDLLFLDLGKHQITDLYCPTLFSFGMTRLQPSCLFLV